MAENPKIPVSPTTANEIYFNRAIRHQIGVRRFSSGEVKKALELLEKSDAELVIKLRRGLAKLKGGRSINTDRFRAMIDDLKVARNELMKKYRSDVRGSLDALVAIEVEFEQEILQQSIPVDIELASIQLSSVRAAIRSKPFSGGSDAARTLGQWFEDLRRADQRRLIEAIQLGVTQGESIDTIVRRVVGTRKNGFRDGVLAISRRNAETIVRTAINHISNAAREEVWEGNEDIIQALKWVSTLDGRTSSICRARDGRFAIIGNKALPRDVPKLIPTTARPPAHPACRSLMIAILDFLGIAGKISDRPFVRDTRTGKQRQRDFRAEARNRDPERWKTLSPDERKALVRKEKERWAETAIGRVPAETTYNDWLLQQPHEFQDKVLGKTKGKLFRTGRLTLDQYVDRRGNELTINQLRETFPEVFTEAGL